MFIHAYKVVECVCVCVSTIVHTHVSTVLINVLLGVISSFTMMRTCAFSFAIISYTYHIQTVLYSQFDNSLICKHCKA